MKNNHFDKNCTDFEELISAAIDGELDHDEFSELESHVDNCSHCRGRYRQMESINDLVSDYESSLAASKALIETSQRMPLPGMPIVDQTTGQTPVYVAALSSDDSFAIGSASTMQARQRKAKPPKKPIDEPGNEKPNGGLAWLAGGALAALGLAAMLTPAPTETLEPTVDASALTQTVQSVTVLNHESMRAQDSQAKTMSYELRAMRLAALNSTDDPKQLEAIQDKIDSIQQRLEQLELRP